MKKAEFFELMKGKKLTVSWREGIEAREKGTVQLDGLPECVDVHPHQVLVWLEGIPHKETDHKNLRFYEDACDRLFDLEDMGYPMIDLDDVFGWRDWCHTHPTEVYSF